MKPRTLLVFVREAFGQPLSGVHLRVTNAGAARSSRSSEHIDVTDRAGMAKLDSLYCADVRLSAERHGFEPRTIEHLLVPPEGATVEIRLAHDWWPW